MVVMQPGARLVLNGRPRTVGVMADDADGHMFALTARGLDARTAAVLAEAGSAKADDLLCAERANGEIRLEPLSGLPLRPPAQADRLLRESIYRHHPDFGQIQGVVAALRGAVEIRLGGRSFIAHDLIEVAFDERNSDAKDTPPLAPEEGGALVCTWTGQVIGLLVAGRGHTAYVAPVGALLDELGLTLRLPGPGVVGSGLHETLAELQAGSTALAGDLAREPSLDLDEAA
jgi:hypothetical protein